MPASKMSDSVLIAVIHDRIGSLSEAGLAGCMDTVEQLPTNYKQHIDFSAKTGVQA